MPLEQRCMNTSKVRWSPHRDRATYPIVTQQEIVTQNVEAYISLTSQIDGSRYAGDPRDIAECFGV